MSGELAQMYDWVRQTREMLFGYCESLPPGLYTREVEGFGWGSMRNLHVHAADCYQHWLHRFVTGAQAPRLQAADHPDVAAVRRSFAAVDALVADFLARHAGRLHQPVTGTVRWQAEPLTLTPLWLLTHTMTHEFHHKGQMVSIGRALGHPAPETDLVLP